MQSSEIDADLRVSALEKSLDLAEKRFVHETTATQSIISHNGHNGNKGDKVFL